MKDSTFKAKFAYWFDNVMARGVISLIGLLGLTSLLFIGIVAAVVSTFKLYPPSGPLNFLEVYWAALLRTLDPGTMGQDDGFGFRFAMLVVTLSGVILVASLIGVISTAFNSRVEQLRKGRSTVLESDHTLILGWNSKVFSIIHEVAIANESRNRPTIVILAPRDKVAMEDEIHSRLRHHGKTRIIVRSGDPMSLMDLQIASPQTARSIVILSNDGDEDADSVTIKTCLALVNGPNRRDSQYRIVGEIRSETNLEAAKLVGKNEAVWVLGEDLISRLIVQTCRQSGLSAVFTELLDFEGAEMYTTIQPELVGLTYGQASLRFEQGCLMGVLENENVVLNPHPRTVLSSNHQLIVVAEDDSSIKVGKEQVILGELIRPVVRPSRVAESTLILGCNASLQDILGEMANYMQPGSRVQIVADLPCTLKLPVDGLDIAYREEDPTNRKVLEGLEVSSFDHIVVLADRARHTTQRGDARTLLSLLHLREMARMEGSRLNIVSEMLDDRNRELASTTDADDFIISDKLVSLMIAQLEENPDLSVVFEKLLSAEGSEIRLHPVEWYVEVGKPVNFNTVIAAASQHGDSAIGFALESQRSTDSRLFGVTLNPDRGAAIVFESGDRLVVLTND